MKPDENPKNKWEDVDPDDYQFHVTISKTGEADERVVYMEDLEKRKQVYGICGECNEPGTGSHWCRPCNAKRFKDNFENWTSGNEDIDEFIQHSQLNAVYYTKLLEWIPYKNFEDVTYITRGGYGKIYSARWPEGNIYSWNNESKNWERKRLKKVALKSLDDSLCTSAEFLNEIKTHLQIYLYDVIQCYGITQDPDTKDYMMVLEFCEGGNLRNNYVKKSNNYYSKIHHLFNIASGLLDIHNAGKVHKDFHSGNILFGINGSLIGDLGMCQPSNEKQFKNEGTFGVLPYIAPEVLRGRSYTKASDIYSFGIMMNEYMSEEIPYNDVLHDYTLAIKICNGHRPSIFEYTPKLLTALITKCWDAKAENRPTAKELFLILSKWDVKAKTRLTIEEFFQIFYKLGIEVNKDSETHAQAIYTTRHLNFKDLPEPMNSAPISLCLDCQLDKSDLGEVNQSDENNVA
ncbi:kinase-like domain-containing protein [Rhizophagus clarus]|uniref:Kinase-like domain-containing protein n=1 Tax=Rhizophagus clarus TaxID=94130 RepID=A0A8H3QEK9_9GLOM|nr:kinase-like domain-containing protein [Rhizophagus clarus]